MSMGKKIDNKMIIRHTAIYECWCPKCGKGQMKQLLDESFKNKKQVNQFKGEKFKCEGCGQENIVDDIIIMIPESYIIASDNEMNKIKANNDMAKHLNDKNQS